MSLRRPVATVPSGEPVHWPPPLPIDANDLDRYATINLDSVATIEAVRSKLPEFRNLLDHLPEDGRGISLDVILMHHAPTRGAPQRNDGTRERGHVIRSQTTILRMLEQMQPKILGVEGYSYERVTPASIKGRNILNGSRTLPLGLEPEQADGPITNACSSFILCHPDMFAIGTEDDDVFDLHYHALMKWAWNKTDEWEWTFTCRAAKLRSVIALSQILRAARSRPPSEAVIVIGAGHRTELEAMMLYAGIAGRIFDASK